MSVLEILNRIRDGERANQSQVWQAGQLMPLVDWVEVATKLLADIGAQRVGDREIQSTARELFQETRLMMEWQKKGGA